MTKEIKCWCHKCHENHYVGEIHGIKLPYAAGRMILCPICGNKRCPHATDHNLPYTNSNEPGQKGSVYE